MTSEPSGNGDVKSLRPVEGAPYLESLAYQHPRYATGGESKRDHAATPEEWAKGREGRTLCGRSLGRWYFPRMERWCGAWSFQCAVCRAVALRLGYIEYRPQGAEA